MGKPDFTELNNAAQELFGQMASSDTASSESSFVDELAQLNNWRLNLLEFACNLGALLDGYRYTGVSAKTRVLTGSLMENISALAAVPTRTGDKKIVIRHRGLSGAARSNEKDFFTIDYVVSVGDCVMDSQQLRYLVQFGIMDAGELGQKLGQTFSFFHAADIYSLEIFYQDWGPADQQRFTDALTSWGRYLSARQKGPDVVTDENSRPDPNLSILAGLNRIPAEKFQSLIGKVHRLMDQNNAREKFKNAESIYDAIFFIDDLKAKLIPSPIEINNNRYIRMWRRCFDDAGRFIRARFTQHRSLFLTWENAFYVFWVDLKSVAVADDREAILNSIVRFIAESRSLDEYMDYILKDFYYYPLHLHFSDRDALFMANLLLLKNYMNITYDFGHTPGEVLFSEDLLNKKLVARLRAMLTERVTDKFVQKIMTVKKLFKASLAAKDKKDHILPVPFLINVMREVFIFLTLVWDKDFKTIVRDTAREYADPQSYLYRSENSRAVILPLLQFFQIIILCLVKIGDGKDVELLKLIRSREENFMSIRGFLTADAAGHKQLVGKIMSVVDEGVIRLGQGV